MNDNIQVKIPSSIVTNFPWKWILAVLFAILGGGSAGITANRFVAVEEKQPKYFNNFANDQKVQHEKIDSIQSEQQGEILSIKERLHIVEEVIREDVARREARRVTESIKNQEKKSQEYIRIYHINLVRLSKGGDPCFDIKCLN